MSQLIDLSLIPALNANGRTVSGAQLSFYESGTLDLVTVYADGDLTVPLPNPLMADAAGRFPAVYVSGGQLLRARLVQKGSIVRDIDPINDMFTASDILVPPFGNLQDFVEQVELGLSVTPDDFGAVGDGVTDDSAAFAAALAASRYVTCSPNKTYLIAAPVAVPSNRHINGRNCKIIQAPVGDYVGVFNCSGQSHIVIENIEFVGDGVPRNSARLTNVSTGAVFGEAGCNNITVQGCTFDNFVFDEGGTCVSFGDCQNITIAFNTWNRNCLRGTDIDLSYRAGSCIVESNRILGIGTVGISIAIVAEPTADFIDPDSKIVKTSHHIVRGNLILKNGGIGKPDIIIGDNRCHGIALHYVRTYAHATISNNIIVGCGRSGIYARGSNINGEVTGPWIISNNIIRYSGGSLDLGTGYNNGIVVDSRQGGQISNNIFEQIGWYPDGTKRPYKAAAIASLRSNTDLLIDGNQIDGTTGGGIVITPTVPTTSGDPRNVNNLRIHRNTIRNTDPDVPAAIVVAAFSDPVLFDNVSIWNNTIYLTHDEQWAMFLSPRLSVHSWDVSDNYIEGTADGINQMGIGLVPGFVGRCTGNTGLNLLALIASAGLYQQPISFGTPDHKYFGGKVIVENNTAIDCNRLLTYSAFERRLQCVAGNNKYLGTTQKPDTSFALVNPILVGQRIGEKSNGTPIMEFVSSATPPTTSASYVEGDRLVYPEPSAGGYLGEVCTAAGTPGTWKTHSPVSA